jgi:hypothetical protein
METSTPTPRPSATPTPNPTDVPSSAILYSEDFEDSEADAWRESYGEWNIEEESNNRFWSGTGPEDYPQAWLDNELDPTINFSTWTDYVFEVRVKFPKPGSLFMCARADGGAAFYNVQLDAENNWVQFADYNGIEVNDGSDYQTFGWTNYTLETDKWYTARFELEGVDLRFYIDDELVISASRDTWESGGIGFYIGGGNEIHFDDIRVWTLDISSVEGTGILEESFSSSTVPSQLTEASMPIRVPYRLPNLHPQGLLTSRPLMLLEEILGFEKML